MSNQDKSHEAIEKSLGTKLPAHAKIELVIHDLDADATKSAVSTVSLGTISATGGVKVSDQAHITNILATLDRLMCW